MIRKKYHKIMLLFYQASWFFKGELRKKKEPVYFNKLEKLKICSSTIQNHGIVTLWCGTFPLFDGSKLITFHMH